MDRHPTTDEQDALNYEGFVRGFSECLNHLVSDDFGNENAFNPETPYTFSSTCVSEDSLEAALRSELRLSDTACSSMKSSINDSVHRAPVEADWTSVPPSRENEYSNQLAISSRNSDSYVRRSHSNVESFGRPIHEISGVGMGLQNVSTLSTLEKGKTERTESDPKLLNVEPRVLGFAEPETSVNICPTLDTLEHDETVGAVGVNPAVPRKNEGLLSMPLRESPLDDSSDFELEAPEVSNHDDTPPWAVEERPIQLRKLDDIGIAQAKPLMKDGNLISEELASSYSLYLDKFEFYIGHYRQGESLMDGVKSVRQMIQRKPRHFSKWNKKFKTEEIPKLLAGVSAVWSILVSEGLSRSMAKPHCFQILCIMRLLGVDLSYGISNHLAQVMSGEGKSVILALLSATLALTGHRVRVAHYNKYLSSRDWQEFQKLFELYEIDDMICYGTFEDMANVFLKPTYKGKETPLHDLMKEIFWHQPRWFGVLSTEWKKAVVLIDELDVLFSPQYYGRTHRIDPRVELKGLDLVQEKIWSLAESKIYSSNAICNRAVKFIIDAANSGSDALVELNAFWKVPGEYALIDCQSGDYNIDRFTNEFLLREHLMRMAEDAKSVVNNNEDEVSFWFQINEEGVICCKDPGIGVYDEHHFSSYKNTFSYFRLKKSGFDTKGFRNYGYLLIDAWQISYARLPSHFPLILGVSGTLTSYSYEKSALETYSIKTFSAFPRLYESKLKFSEHTDFRCAMHEENWYQNICESARQVVENFRAVLIVFKSEKELQAFRRRFMTELRPMQVLTKNELFTSLGNTFITLAGAPRTVTLLTCDTARGVEYRPTIDVENAGGIHVIQTFFSLDIKEENIIKGRTARRGNKGSYELIVCREQLVADRIIYKDDSNAYTYSILDNMRTRFMNEKGEQVSAEISKNETRHDNMMLFFGFDEKPSFKTSESCCLS